MKKRIRHKLEKRKYNNYDIMHHKLCESKKKIGSPRGKWIKELNLVRFKAFGYHCVVARIPNLGHLCGYVAIDDKHPLHLKDYPALIPNVKLYAHGGITYSYASQGVVSINENDNLWWLGFDCAHFGDYLPYNSSLAMKQITGMDDLNSDMYGGDFLYKTVGYVKQECIQLAKQLRDIENKQPKLIGTPNRYPNGVLTYEVK